MIVVKAPNKFSVQFQIIDYICSTTDFIIVWTNIDGYTVSDYIKSITKRKKRRPRLRTSSNKYVQRKLDEFISYKKSNTFNRKTKTQNLYKEDMNTDTSNGELLNNFFIDKIKII